MHIRYISAIMIGLLFSIFYQAPVLAKSELAQAAEIAVLQHENKSPTKTESFIRPLLKVIL